MQGWLSLYFTALLVNVSSCSLFDIFHQGQEPVVIDSLNNGRDLISFTKWEVIGPFRSGTRGQ